MEDMTVEHHMNEILAIPWYSLMFINSVQAFKGAVHVSVESKQSGWKTRVKEFILNMPLMVRRAMLSVNGFEIILFYVYHDCIRISEVTDKNLNFHWIAQDFKSVDDISFFPYFVGVPGARDEVSCLRGFSIDFHVMFVCDVSLCEENSACNAPVFFVSSHASLTSGLSQNIGMYRASPWYSSFGRGTSSQSRSNSSSVSIVLVSDTPSSQCKSSLSSVSRKSVLLLVEGSSQFWTTTLSVFIL